MTIDVIFNLISKNTSKVSGQFNKINSSISRAQGCLWKFNQTAELMDRMGAMTDVITAPFKQFEQSMADLSAITGTTGADLDKLGEVARKVGVTSGLGATGAVDAFKLLASQIDVNKIGLDGLMELQSKTITLAQASGMSLTDAANSMAGTINQFGLEASEAKRVIDVLAAGSKYGAAEIPELAQSFKVVGAAANAAGLSVEQTAGAIEVLSKNNLKGAEAGTAMRNIMLKMQTSLGVDFKTTSFADALDGLKPKLNDVAYLSKLFGMENIAAAQFLITNSKSVEEMTAKVTGTNTAMEQATISTDTWNHRLKVQAARFNEWSMKVTDGNQEILSAIQVASQFGGVILTFAPLFSMLGGGFKMIGAGVGSIRKVAKAFKLMNAAMKIGKLATLGKIISNFGIVSKITAAGLWMKTTALNALNFAQLKLIPAMSAIIVKTWAWTAALFANPITWIIIGIGALVAAIVVCWNKFAGFRAVIMTVWDVIKGFGVAIYESITAPFEVAIAMIKGVIGAIKALLDGDFSGAWDAIKGAVTSSIDAVVKPFNTVVETVTEVPGNFNEHLTTEKAKDKAKEADKEPNPTGNNTISPGTIVEQNKNDTTKVGGVEAPKALIAGERVERIEIPKSTSSITKESTAEKSNTSVYTTQPQGKKTSSRVTVNYNPVINISAEMTEKSSADVMAVLEAQMNKIVQMITNEMRKNERGSYGLS